MIRFEKITYDNVDEILGLCVREDQKHFVASNTASLVDAYVALSMGAVALPFGIYDGDTLVGFIMFGHGSLDDEDEPEVARDNYCLWRFMIDEHYQHQGLGTQALRHAIDWLKTWPAGKAKYCWLSYEKENLVAKAMYEKAGFTENGELCGSELVAVLPLTNK